MGVDRQDALLHCVVSLVCGFLLLKRRPRKDGKGSVVLFQELFLGEGVLELRAIDAKRRCLAHQKEIDDATIVGLFETRCLPFAFVRGVAENDKPGLALASIVLLGGFGGA